MRAGAIAGDTEERVSNVFAVPLFISMAGFTALFVALLLIRTRTEIRNRRTKALVAREMLK
jgi:heme exporter protein C